MTDNQDKAATRREEPHDLEDQQQELFDELSREQVDAEQALEEDQEK